MQIRVGFGMEKSRVDHSKIPGIEINTNPNSEFFAQDFHLRDFSILEILNPGIRDFS